MKGLFERLRVLIRLVVRHPVRTLVTTGVLSGLAFALAAQLTIDTDLARLLPRSYPSVQALEHLRETVGGESAASVIIESPSFDANRAFAETLIPEALDLKPEPSEEPYLVRVEYRKEVAFLQENALYFATDRELEALETYLQRQWMRTQSIGLGGPGRASQGEGGLENAEAYRDIIPKEYPVSEDSTTMVVKFYPSGAQTNLDFVERLYRDLEALVDRLEPSSLHPEMEVFVGGRLERQLVEIQAVRRDLISSVGGGVATVLLVVMLYFGYKGFQVRRGRGRLVIGELVRLPVAALLIGLPLAMSLAWTFGIAYLVYGTLNVMTAMLALILFGLGVDYGIHYFARYTEERGDGLDVMAANEQTFLESGPAIAVSALTTAASLFVLLVADFQGFSQFGAVAGTGILLAMMATVTVLPALVSLCERIGWLRLDAGSGAEPEPTLPTEQRYPAAKPLLVVCLVVTVVALALVPRLRFEYRFGELEPTFERYEELRAKEGLVYPTSKRNPAYLVIDDPDDVNEVTEELRRRAETDSTILSVESLQERFPMTAEDQQNRLERLARLRRILDRPALRSLGGEDVARLRSAAQTTESIELEQVPDFLKAQFTSRTGELGNFVIVYPAVGLSDGRNSILFSEAVGTVELSDGTVYRAASTSIVAADMLQLLFEESPFMIALTSTVLLILLWVMFRSIKWTILAAAPLVVGVVWMMGAMGLFDVRLNFYNLVVLPAVLGIGVDGGVHLIHRYRDVERCCLGKIMRSTGQHIAVGSLTTLIAFAWWLFSFHPGLNSIGQLAVVGIGAVLAVALVALPAYLQWREDATEPQERSVTLE